MRNRPPLNGRLLLQRAAVRVLDQGIRSHTSSAQHILEVMQSPFRKGAFPNFLSTWPESVAIIRGPSPVHPRLIKQVWSKLRRKLECERVPMGTILADELPETLNGLLVVVKDGNISPSVLDERNTQVNWFEFSVAVNRYLDSHKSSERTLPQFGGSSDPRVRDFVRSLSL